MVFFTLSDLTLFIDTRGPPDSSIDMLVGNRVTDRGSPVKCLHTSAFHPRLIYTT